MAAMILQLRKVRASKGRRPKINNKVSKFVVEVLPLVVGVYVSDICVDVR